MTQSGTNPCDARRLQRGFTLLELLIAVVVVAILAALAYPSFMGAIRKSRRAEGIAALNQVQQAQERFRANNTLYSSNLTAAPTATPAGLGLSANTSTGYYTIALSGASATGYTATATAVAGTSQAADAGCKILGVRMNGAVLEYGGADATPLTYAATNRCWAR